MNAGALDILHPEPHQCVVRSMGKPAFRTSIPVGWLTGRINAVNLRSAVHLLADAFGTQKAKRLAGKVLGVNPRRMGEMMSKADLAVLSFEHWRARAFCETVEFFALIGFLPACRRSLERNRELIASWN